MKQNTQKTNFALSIKSTSESQTHWVMIATSWLILRGLFTLDFLGGIADVENLLILHRELFLFHLSVRISFLKNLCCAASNVEGVYLFDFFSSPTARSSKPVRQFRLYSVSVVRILESYFITAERKLSCSTAFPWSKDVTVCASFDNVGIVPQSFSRENLY